MNTAEITTVAPSDPTDATLTTSRALLAVVSRSLAEALDLVSLAQFRVLVILATSAPLRMGALAARAHSVPSTFSRSIDRMVAGGWVKRSESPDSRREVLIELTPRGLQLVNDVTERRRHEIAVILERVPESDREKIAAAFAMFAAAAGEPPVEDLVALGV